MEYIAIAISILTLSYTINKSRNEKKVDSNNLVRLFILSKNLNNNFHDVMFNYKMIYFIPGSTNDYYLQSFDEAYFKMTNRIQLIYELLITNKEISITDLQVIIENLDKLEGQLIELKHFKVDEQSDFDIVLSIENPIKKYMEISHSIIQQYNHY